jgi:AmmeMemoRadiSam system protein A
MAVDNQVASSLAAASDRLVLDASVFQDEHSVATQLPFVHQALPGVPVVPIVVGAPTADNVDALAAALCRVLAHRRPLLVASSDLSHYPSQADAVRVDGALLESLLTLDPVKVRQTIDGQSAAGVPNLETSACGEGGILAVMRAAVSLGADQATVVSYRNSGDTPLGDPDRVVGYGAVAFFAGSQVGGAGRQRSALPPTAAVAETASGQMATLAPDEMASLLALARSTLEQYLRTESVPSAVPQSADLRQVRGAFVTLTRDGELRGCMGSLVGRRPLYLQVQNSALMAATEDPRFYPVTLDELADLKIEISALGPLEPVTDVNQIQVGKHGLVIEQGRRAGTLLPQVPTEYGWDRDEFLRQLCRKAGLPDEAWRTSSLFRYTAEVFGEH